MTVLLMLLPVSLAMATAALGAFIWCARTGQLDDLESPAARLLIDDVRPTRTVGDIDV